MSRWYRAYEGTVTDAKLAEAAMIAGCSRSVAIAAWHCLLESAAGRNNCGSYDATPRRIAVILCEPLATVEPLFAAFEELSLIADGAVAAWKRRQYESDKSTERSRKHREGKRNGDATLQQQDATPPETETEPDTDTEETVSNETVVGDRPEIAVIEVKPEHVLEAWNEMADRTGVHKARMTPERRKKLHTFTKRHPIDDITEAIGAIERSSFCRGDGPRGWKAGIDFMLQPTTFTKLIEGTYEQ